MKRKTYSGGLLGGQNDTGLEEGTELPALRVCRNTRFSLGAVSRRKGIQRVGRTSLVQTAYDLDGTDDDVTIPLNTTIHTLRREWGMETLLKVDTLATQQSIFGVAHASDYSVRMYLKTDGKLEAKVQDSAATVTTLVSTSTFTTSQVLAILLKRKGTALTLMVNGTTEDSDTMADLDCKAPGGDLYIGRDNTANRMNGAIDFLRVLSFAPSNQNYGKQRLSDPLAPYVLMNYDMEDTDNVSGRCCDGSRFQNHATVNGTPTTTTSLSVQSNPITGIYPWLTNEARQRLFIASGKRFYVPLVGR